MIKIRLIVPLFFMLFYFAGHAQSLQDSLMFFYPFDGNAKDYSGYGFDSQVNGAILTADRFGNPNAAYSFDGIDDYLELPNDPFLQSQLPITISMWVNIDDVSSTSCRIFSTCDDPNVYAGIGIRLDPYGSGTVAVSYGSGGGSGQGNRRTVMSTTSLVSQTWHHLVFVIRGATDMDIYIDGDLDQVTYSGGGGNIYYSAYPARLGTFDGSPAAPEYFHGAVDDLRLWNRALLPEDVALMRNGLILDMPFTGDANDVSGNGLHGQLNGPTLIKDRFQNTDQALLFDGVDDAVDLPNAALLKPQFPIAFSMWVKPEEVNQVYNPIFSNDDAQDFYSGLWVQLDPAGTGSVSVSYGDGSGSGPNSRRSATGILATKNREWNHIAGVIRGPQDFEFWVNGVHDTLNYSGSGGAVLYTDNPGSIGAFDGTSNSDKRFFAGAIDDVKIGQINLTEQDIEYLYTPGSTTTGLVDVQTKGSSDIQFYPNPVQTKIFVRKNAPEQIEKYELFNYSGQRLAGTVWPEGGLDVSALPVGTYVLRLLTTSGVKTMRFVKA